MARGKPIRAGRRYVPPAPGMMARFAVSGRARTASAAKTRKVVERASSRPPPKAEEEIALMVGMGRFEMEV